MSAPILLTGFGIFVISFLFYRGVSRVFAGKMEMLLLFACLLFVPCTALITWFRGLGRPFEEWAAIAAVEGSLALMYLATFPALKSKIPTFEILILIDKKSPCGVTSSEIAEILGQEESLFSKKVEELGNDLLVRQEGGRLTLSIFGAVVAGVFITYRKLLGFEKGLG